MLYLLGVLAQIKTALNMLVLTQAAIAVILLIGILLAYRYRRARRIRERTGP